MQMQQYDRGHWQQAPRAFLYKPFEPKALLDAVRIAVAKSQI
jgi:hypothetical protein